MATINRVISAAERALSRIAGGIAMVLTLIIVVQVVARNFGHSIAGTFEASELIMVGIVFLGIAYTQAQRGHMSIDLLFKRFPHRLQNSLDTAFLLLALIAFSIITYRSGQDAYQAWQIGDIREGLIPFPFWPSKILVPIGCGTLCLRFILQLISSISPFVAAKVVNKLPRRLNERPNEADML